MTGPIRTQSRVTASAHYTKDHQCPTCSKVFKKLSDLTRHLRVHTDERPYTCDLCPKSFKQSNQLAAHVNTHTGEKPFACPQTGCSKRYADPSALNRHSTRSHGATAAKARAAKSASPMVAFCSTSAPAYYFSESAPSTPALSYSSSPSPSSSAPTSPVGDSFDAFVWSPINDEFSLLPCDGLSGKQEQPTTSTSDELAEFFNSWLSPEPFQPIPEFFESPTAPTSLEQYYATWSDSQFAFDMAQPEIFAAYVPTQLPQNTFDDVLNFNQNVQPKNECDFFYQF